MNSQPVGRLFTLGYVRVSSGKQELSIEVQGGQIRRFTAFKGLPEAEIIPDEDTSGGIVFAQRKGGRAVLQRIQRAVADGREVHLIVPKVDRFARDTVDVSQTVRTLDTQGMRVHFLDINVDTRTPMGRAFMQIAAVFAELELARITERIRNAMDEKRYRGELTGTVPYGWTAEQTGHTSNKGVKVRRVLDCPEEQRWILRMIARREAGWSYHAIANELNRLGVPTKRGAGALIKYNGATQLSRGQWQSGNVSHVLNNKTVRAWLVQLRNPECGTQNDEVA